MQSCLELAIVTPIPFPEELVAWTSPHDFHIIGYSPGDQGLWVMPVDFSE